MKIVITGGHITPALALLPILSKKHDVLFVIRKYAYEGDWGLSFEYKTIKELGFPFKVITAGRLQRSFTAYTLPSLLKFPIGFIQSLIILLHFRPAIILSFGGYVGLPVCLAAFFLGIPIVAHEQTIKVGFANRIISFFAKKICVAFKESLQYFPAKKVVFTGNPIRKELFQTPQKPPFLLPTSFPIIYITGGSGGSHDINMLIRGILNRLLEKYVVIHQIGNIKMFHDSEKLLEKQNLLPDPLRRRYISAQNFSTKQLAWIYKHVTLLVGRSGANTVYEILTFGIPSLLIPLAWAGSSEQEANAKLVENIGLGKILRQKDLTENKLFTTIEEMVLQHALFEKKKTLAKEYVIPNAEEKLLEILETSST